MKKFIASGCSFTFEDWNWPTHVTEEFNWKLYNVGMGSMGNRLIANRCITKVQKLLNNGINSKDIVVGVMWSGIDRYDLFCHRKDKEYLKSTNNSDGAVENPTYLSDKNYKDWEILNYNWSTSRNKSFYSLIHRPADLIVQTLNHIIMVQGYLKTKGIKYFMTTYMSYDSWLDPWMSHPDISLLYNMIDFDNFLPINGCLEWCQNLNDPEICKLGASHPEILGHKVFSNKVVIPYIKDKFI